MPPSLFTRQKPQPRLRMKALTAAASRVMKPGGTDIRRPEDYKPTEWQKQAWSFYDLIGELRYGARYYGNSLSQMRLLVGWKADAGSNPMPVDPANPPEGLDMRDYRIAVDTLNRLHSADGTAAEILRQFGVNLFVAGEGYLVGRVDRTTNLERWDFYSTEQLVWLNGNWYLKENLLWRTDQLIQLDPDRDYIIRIWQPHPRYSDEPDSPMRSILTLCEELMLLTANIRATSLSRIPAGILLMPDTMLDAGPDYEPENLNDDSLREQQSQSALEEIYQHFITPIADPNSAASVAPFILTGDPEDLEQVRLIEFDRDADEVAAQQRAEILRRIAHGVDLPSEILNGMGSVNHWTAWQIEESSYKSHIRPAASLFCGSITSQLLWPAIRVATGREADQRLVVTFDPIDLISHIDRRLNAKDGHASLVISDEAYRRALGFTDEDAPDELEYKRRMAVQNAALSLTPVAAGEMDSVTQALDESVARVRPGVPTPESIGEDPDPRGRKPIIEREIETGEPGDVAVGPAEPITSSAKFQNDLGRKLMAVDSMLLERLEDFATASMRRALERAGARIRSKTGKDAELKASLSDVSNMFVGAHLGQETVRDLFQTGSPISEEDFADLEQQYDSLTRRGQRQVRQLAREYGLDPANLEAMERQQDLERDEGWAILLSLMMGTAAVLLFRPDISSELMNGNDLGEFDEVSMVPTRIIRASLSVAGGDRGISVSDGTIINIDDSLMSLLASGVTTLDYLEEAGVTPSGYRWVYGDEMRKPFEPHLDLDGYEFASWDDGGLANGESFPDSAFFYPGDHNGCRCMVEYVFET